MAVCLNGNMILEQLKLKCPDCASEAIYKYGKAWTGKQRFVCMICRRQFTLFNERMEVKGKPDCPNCGKGMHLYKREEGAIRFRCSGYPGCRTFKKTKAEEKR